MNRDMFYFGFYLTITLGLAQAFLDDSELIQDYPLAVVAFAAGVATVLATFTTLWLQRSHDKAHADATAAQAAHEQRMRRLDRGNNGKGDLRDRI